MKPSPVLDASAAAAPAPASMTPQDGPLRSDFVHAMRLTAASVAVVTTDGDAGRAGVTVSALCSLSADPPSVLVCVHQACLVLPIILANGRLCVNLLTPGQTHVADSFAGRIARWRDDRFACAEWDEEPGGCPALRGAQARLHCSLAQNWLFGSHRVLVGLVRAVDSTSSDGLLYADRSYRTIGLQAPLHQELYA